MAVGELTTSIVRVIEVPRALLDDYLLMPEGALVLDGVHYFFQRDVLFKGPSGASDTVTGASTSGWTVWRNKDGKTLDELKRTQAVETES